jgi:hypothetical protein
VQLLAHRALVELVAVAAHHVDRRHDHAGRAEAALQRVILVKRLLHRMQRVALRQALDGDHLAVLAGERQHRARFHADTVEMHRAAAALAGVAAHMGAGEAQMLAQELNQQGASLHLAGNALAVHRHAHDGHAWSSWPPLWPLSLARPCRDMAGHSPELRVSSTASTRVK